MVNAETLPPQLRTLPEMLIHQAARHGAKPLLRLGDTIWSFAQTQEVAARAAGRFAAAGVRRGDRVAMLCTNRIELLECLLGCGWMGAIAVPINAASRGMQLQHILANSAPRLLVIEAAQLGALDQLDTSPIGQIWVVGARGIGAGEDPRRPAMPAPMPGLGEAVAPAELRPGDTFAILYTSGTTGPSKGVCCPHAQYYWWGALGVRMLDLREDDVLATSLPLFHTNAIGTFFQALLCGATLLVLPRFSVSGFWQTLVDAHATVTYLLGAMVPMLLAQDVSAAEGAHRVRAALAPGVPGDLQARFTKRTGIALMDGYGSTETNFVIGGLAEDLPPGSMGPVIEGFAARVVDADDNALPDGSAGELVLRTEAPFAFATGYWAMPEQTITAWRNLWFHTGDRVVRDALGNYRFVDRMKDAIRRRGENISSYEVEQVLLSHPAVATAAAYPVRSDLAEDEVMVAIVFKAGLRLTPHDLIRFCEGKMPYFAVPRFVVFDEALPVTENGKVQKYKLIARGITPDAWDREASGMKISRA